MAIRKLGRWWKVLWPGNYWSALKRIYHGWCWRCGGEKGDEHEHLHGCSSDNGGVHLEDHPWIRLRWSLAMVPLGVLVAMRVVLIGVVLAAYLPLKAALLGLGVDNR